jgi:hypothetical protein
MIKKYSELEKITAMYDMEVRPKETEELNELFKPFNDEEIDLITKINHIYFKIGFRCAADLFK